MHNRTRARGIALRAQSTLSAIRVPVGAIPLAIAMLILVAVPIARAATTEGNPTGGTPSQERTGKATGKNVHISGKLTTRKTTGRSGIRIRGIVTGAGASSARVRLKVRRIGTKNWSSVATRVVKGGHHFTLKWTSGKPGRYRTRITVNKAGRVISDTLGNAYIFRRSYASYYGPGLYGGGLACGGRLSPSTVGVAHKTLPCGTKVTFKLGGRTVTTRVIDRGPYIAGRDWDLTSALKHKLGFGSTGTVYSTH